MALASRTAEGSAGARALSPEHHRSTCPFSTGGPGTCTPHSGIACSDRIRLSHFKGAIVIACACAEMLQAQQKSCEAERSPIFREQFYVYLDRRRNGPSSCHNLCMFNVSPVLVLAVGGLTAAQARYRVLQVSLSNDLVTNPSSLSRVLLRCAGHSEHSLDAVARDMIIARASLLFVELSVSFRVMQILERKPLDLPSVIALVELS